MSKRGPQDPCETQCGICREWKWVTCSLQLFGHPGQMLCLLVSIVLGRKHLLEAGEPPGELSCSSPPRTVCAPVHVSTERSATAFKTARATSSIPALVLLTHGTHGETQHRYCRFTLSLQKCLNAPDRNGTSFPAPTQT